MNLQMLYIPHVIFTRALGSVKYYSHFTGKETDAEMLRYRSELFLLACLSLCFMNLLFQVACWESSCLSITRSSQLQ